jgi:putative cardiolipin synthase
MRFPPAIVLLVSALLAGPAGRAAPAAVSAPPPAPPLAELVTALMASRAPGPAGTSAVALLDTGADALRVRDALIEAARDRIDAQYYIWNADASGRYLAARLLAAAGRGVRVRVLLDDVNLALDDPVLAALVAHPHVAVRVYNPLPGRRGVARVLSFLGDFGRLNRRMHNKSFTVDGVVTVIGGRNVGDEYFDLDPEVNFRDRELVAVGPVVAGVGDAFEAFWRSPFTTPAGDLPGNGAPSTRPDPAALVAATLPAVAAAGYAAATAPLDWFRGRVLAELVFAPVRLVWDPPPDPATAADATRPQPVATALRELVAATHREVLVESAYFILGDESLATAGALTSRGVRLRALTNSLASNDLVTNHSGYARRRPAMLRAGIELHELRPDAAACLRLVTVSPACTVAPGFSLHSKSLVLDRRVVYVGSFNLNLRSAYLNSETALIVESPELAARVAASIEELLAPASSWEVRLAGDGAVEWRGQGADGGAVVTRREPASGAWRRFQSGVYGLFPLEKYL